MKKCTFYTHLNTSTTDVIFGVLSADEVTRIETSSEEILQLQVKLTGGNVPVLDKLIIKSHYVELFIEGSYSLSDVQILDTFPNDLAPIGSLISVVGRIKI